MKKLSLALAAIMLLSIVSGCSMLPQSAPVEEETAPEEIPAYGYIAAEELKTKLEAGEELVLVDIQPEEYYEQAHLPGSLSTGAYPADTDELRSMLDAAIDSINATTAPVIIIGMGGKTGAENAAEYYALKGVPADRLFILEGGSVSWPYDELLWYDIDYQYMTPDQLKERMDKREGVMLIDVRPEENYNAGHIKGALSTNSYPNNTKEQWAKLSELKAQVESTLDPVVIIGMNGKEGAENAISYFASEGVDERKFYILEGGGNNWPHADMLEIVPTYQYIEPADLKAKIEAQEPMILLSVQTKENYRETGHLPNSIPTYSFPANTAELRENLDDEVDALKENDLPIYVMCHGGKDGAFNSITHYVNKHKIDQTRFYIIKGGITAWPFKDMLVLGRD